MKNKLVKTVLIIGLIIGIVVILYYGRTLLLPLAFAGLLAMLFTPLSEKLENKGVPRWGSITICVLILLLAIGVVLGAVSWQAKSLVEDWSKVQQEFQSKAQDFETYLTDNVGLTEEQIQQFKERFSGRSSQLQAWAGRFFGSFISVLGSSLLVIIYLILLLMARERITAFVLRLARDDQRDTAREIMWSAREIASKYLVGRLILIGILAVVYAIGFSVFGLQYAIPIAILAAVLTIIPYLGNIIGGVIALGMGLVTSGGVTVLLGVLGTMSFAQVLESYVLEPWIVGKKVTLNPLFTVVSIIAFSTVWGIAGTILALPITGMLKEAFDRIPPLHPFAFLMDIKDFDKDEIER